MPQLAAVNHVSLSVTDLDRSEAFYTEVLGLMVLMDFGMVRVLIDRASSFQVALVRHAEGAAEPFSELNTGLDHLGFRAENRDELEDWVSRFEAAGVSYTPIQDLSFGHHLNFRDPDGIPLEFYVPNDFVTKGWQELRDRDVSREEIAAQVQQALGGSSSADPG